ncbi:unnamed protein product [Pylaiella littoralis]
MLQRSRSVAAGLALGGLISTQLHSNTHAAAAAAAAAEGNMRLGSKECPLDISVLWTAELDSPVYSTPVILPSSAGSRKQQIVLATLRTVELLEGDGSVRYPWPVEMDDHDGAAFLAPPALHDVDGDGVQDICVADTMGLIRWLTPGAGGGGPYLPEHRQYLDRRRVSALQTAVEDHEDADPDRVLRRARRRLLDGDEVEHGDESRPDAGSAALPNDQLEIPGTGDGLAGYGNQGWGEGGGDDGFDTAAAYAAAMQQWGEYGTGPYPSDDGTGWLAGYGDDFGLDNLAGGEDVDRVKVDPHITAAPVFFEALERKNRMVVSVSYFTTKQRSPDDIEKYAAGALACWDFEDSVWLWTHDLGQTYSGDLSGGVYVDASPTVGDLDGDGSLEVIVGTVRGGLHVVDASSGAARNGFPVTYGEIRGQVAIADVDGNQHVEMLLGDASGTVVCVNHDGTELWNKRLPGSIKSMVTLGDVDGDGTLDVVVAVATAGAETEVSGELWALKAESGLPLRNFPVELHNRKGISAPVTLGDLHERTAGDVSGAASTDAYGFQGKRGGGAAPIGGWGTGLHLLAPSEDGHVYVVEGATGCVNKIDLGERVRSMVLADDVDGDGTLDLVVGTMSGEVVALSANVPVHPLNTWRSQVRGPANGFAHGGYQGVYFMEALSDYGEMVGRHFALTFEIVDASAEQRTRGRKKSEGQEDINKPYQVTIFAGTEEIFRHAYERPGVQVATVSLKAPRHELLRIEMRIRPQTLVFEDHVFVGYNTKFYVAFKWMIVAPMALAALPLFWWADRSSTGSGGTSLPG